MDTGGEPGLGTPGGRARRRRTAAERRVAQRAAARAAEMRIARLTAALARSLPPQPQKASRAAAGRLMAAPGSAARDSDEPASEGIWLLDSARRLGARRRARGPAPRARPPGRTPFWRVPVPFDEMDADLFSGTAAQLPNQFADPGAGAPAGPIADRLVPFVHPPPHSGVFPTTSPTTSPTPSPTTSFPASPSASPPTASTGAPPPWAPTSCSPPVFRFGAQLQAAPVAARCRGPRARRMRAPASTAEALRLAPPPASLTASPTVSSPAASPTAAPTACSLEVFMFGAQSQDAPAAARRCGPRARRMRAPGRAASAAETLLWLPCALPPPSASPAVAPQASPNASPTPTSPTASPPASPHASPTAGSPTRLRNRRWTMVDGRWAREETPTVSPPASPTASPFDDSVPTDGPDRGGPDPGTGSPTEPEMQELPTVSPVLSSPRVSPTFAAILPDAQKAYHVLPADTPAESANASPTPVSSQASPVAWPSAHFSFDPWDWIRMPWETDAHSVTVTSPVGTWLLRRLSRRSLCLRPRNRRPLSRRLVADCFGRLCCR